VSNATGGSRLGEHAVYPGTFDPISPGHLDIIERARHLFARITVLVAVNADKHPASTQSQRAIQLRRKLPANWNNVSVTARAGLTVAFCRGHDAGVIIRGVRNRSDLRYEYQLAAMNEPMGITTLLLPAQPALAGRSSRVLRGLGTELITGSRSANHDPPEGPRPSFRDDPPRWDPH
jgi:pantetheine-phosphate adenylyltransferase